jgi:hypothetical protein
MAKQNQKWRRAAVFVMARKPKQKLAKNSGNGHESYAGNGKVKSLWVETWYNNCQKCPITANFL